jgi:hypothetical protein
MRLAIYKQAFPLLLLGQPFIAWYPLLSIFSWCGPLPFFFQRIAVRREHETRLLY